MWYVQTRDQPEIGEDRPVPYLDKEIRAAISKIGKFLEYEEGEIVVLPDDHPYWQSLDDDAQDDEAREP
jgi:hypothetical protein